MILTVTIILSFLIGINFLLLLFSCNKTTKRKTSKEKVHTIKPTSAVQQTSTQLAPTGS